MMRVITDISKDKVWAAVWLAGRADTACNDCPRHDSVRASIERTTGRADIRSLIDIGLPVLQLKRTQFRPSPNDFETISTLLDDESSAAAFGEALVLCVLARHIDLPITDNDGADAADAAFDSDLLDIDTFMNVGLEVNGGPRESQQAALRISEGAAKAGISTAILVRAGDSIHPALHQGFASETDDSALLGMRMMAADGSRHSIDLPEGFAGISLEAADSALCAIAVPQAVSVHYFGDTTSERHKVRNEAASAYPLLAERLAIDPELQAIIETARPLGPALTERTGLTRGHLKRLKKMTTPLPQERLSGFDEAGRGADPVVADRSRRHSIGGDLTLEQLCRLLSGYPANWVPNSEAAWIAFLDIISACAFPIINAGFGLSLSSALAAAKGDWAGYKSTLARAYGMEPDEFDRRQMALATADAIEMVEDFSRSIIVPLLLGAVSGSGHPLPKPSPDLFLRSRAMAFRIMIGEAKNIFGSLLSAARSWTSRIPALIEAEGIGEAEIAQAAELSADGSWPRLAGDFTAANGLVVQNLVSETELKEESKRLRHCVGRLYVRKARAGNCHIFSVRRPDLSESYSTIELSPAENGPKRFALSALEIWQHKAKSNRRPSAIALAAGKEWLAALRSGSHPADIDTVRRWRRLQLEAQMMNESSSGNSAAAIQFNWAAALGRRWQSAAVRDAVWNEWKSHILRGALGSARSPDFLVTQPGMRELLEALCPSAAATDRSVQSAD